MTQAIHLKKLVVLISGAGSNLQAIINACENHELKAEIVAVVSNNQASKGLERAHQAGIPTVVKTPAKNQLRSEYDAELANLIKTYNPDWIVLAGWMRLLSHSFLMHFPNQVINLHPALPGIFPGANAIERAFHAFTEGKITETGVIVHLVPDEGIDSGPVLNQMKVPIYSSDTLATLTQRMHAAEHELLINTLKKM